jgi:metal-responsive CopG/Arc/MetJ family transcriptional regulator
MGDKPLAIRFPDDLLRKIDRIAKQASKQSLTKVNRSDVIRAAVVIGLTDLEDAYPKKTTSSKGLVPTKLR